MSGDPHRMASVWPEMPFMRGEVGSQRLRDWLPQSRQIRNQTANRRERVLAYPWARKRLCYILALADAEQWTGSVPSALDDEGKPNTSTIRRALMDLLREVAQADLGTADQIA